MPDGEILAHILVLIGLILINAFLSMSELAIISFNDSKLRKLSEEGNKKASILVALTARPSKFLSAMQISITFCGFLASAFSASAFSKYILQHFAISSTTIYSICIVLVTLILSFFIIVFGQFVPKKIASNNYEKIAFNVAYPISIVCKIERPFLYLIDGLTNIVLRAIGIDPNYTVEEVTEEGIRMMVDAGNERGTIEESEKDMINNIFEFDNRTAEEFMTHRTDMTAIEMDTPIDEIISIAVKDGHSRIPVYKDDLDDIVGILYVKDLLELVIKEKEFNISNYMRKAMFVPETNHCKELFQQFKEKKIQMAIVVDEYGGTSGLITMEDLIESIVGNIQDEYDDEDEEISQLSQNVFIIEGITSIEDVKKLFDIEFDEDDDYDTIGGYIIDQIGHIPSEDEHPVVSISGIDFTVLNMDERRISKIRAERKMQSENFQQNQ